MQNYLALLNTRSDRITWRLVTKLLCGAEDEAARYAAIADLPQYRSYFESHQGLRKRMNAARWFNETKNGMSLVQQLMLRLEWS
jgi:hypothetical protein